MSKADSRFKNGFWCVRELGFGKGFVAGGVLGICVGVAVFALVPVLVLAVLGLAVGSWFCRRVVTDAKAFRDLP